MNNKTLFGMLAIGLLALAGSASATGASVLGYASAQADASASYDVDYSGAVEAAEDAKAQAEATAYAGADAAMSAKAQAEAEARAKAEAGAQASASAKTNLMDGIRSNVGALASWAQSLWVKPHADVQSETATNLVGSAGSSIEPGHVGAAGAAHADLVTDLESTASVDYNLPPPPQPKLDFFAEIKAAFSGFLGIGA